MARWTDDRLDRTIGHLLRAGVVISAVVVLAGGWLYLTRTHETPDRRTFHGEPAELSHPVAIVRSACAGDDLGVIAFGLLLLIATPVARVAMAAYGFLREHDWLYTAVAAFVLVVLLVSLAGPY